MAITSIGGMSLHQTCFSCWQYSSSLGGLLLLINHHYSWLDGQWLLVSLDLEGP